MIVMNNGQEERKYTWVDIVCRFVYALWGRLFFLE